MEVTGVDLSRPLVNQELVFATAFVREGIPCVQPYPLPIQALAGAKLATGCYIDPARAQEAVTILTQSHPFLQISVSRKWNSQLALIPTTSPVPVVLATISTGADGKERSSTQCTTFASLDDAKVDALNRHWLPNEPLVRLTLVQAAGDRKETRAFFFCGSHVICDGRSVELLVRGFFDILCRGNTELVCRTLKHAYHILQECPELLQPPSEGLLLEPTPLQADQGDSAFKPCLGKPNSQHCNKAKQTGYAVRNLTFTASETIEILQVCRNSLGVTVNSFLVAIISRTIALQSSYAASSANEEVNACTCNIPIDTRRHFPEFYQSAIGNNFAGLNPVMKLSSSLKESCTHVDSLVKYHLQPHVMTKQVMSNGLAPPNNFATIYKPLKDLVGAPETYRCKPCISNLGVVGFATCDSLKVESSFWCGGGYPFVDVFVCIITTNGILSIDLVHLLPWYSSAETEKLAADVYHAVLQGCQDPESTSTL